MTRSSYPILLACCLTLGVTHPVHADESDVLHLRASVNLTHDDNLFRTPDNGGQKPQSDTITTTIAGLDFNKRLSLQQFIAHVSWVDNRYQRNDHLDAGALQYDGSWLWEISSQLRGEVAADHSAAQNSFADFQGLRQRNLRTIENQRFNLNYLLHPSWQLSGGVFRQTVSNDQLLLADSDLEATGARFGLRYTPASGNVLGWAAKRLDGKYVQRPFDPNPGILFDDEFTQTGQEFEVHWQPTGHSSINGRLEYLQRRHAHFSARDFAGWAGQLSYQYQYSDKTVLSAGYLRDLAAFQQTSSSYSVTDDLSVGVQWAFSGKVGLGGRLGYAHRRYVGEILPLPAGQPERDDRSGHIGVDLSYQAENWLVLRTSLVKEKRNSNLPGLDYTDRQVQFSASARF